MKRTKLLSAPQVIDYCFQCGEGQLGTLVKLAYQVREENFPQAIRFYSPGMVHYEVEFHRSVNPYRFPAVSVTGRHCPLKCDHCRGKLLRGMLPAETPPTTSTRWQER